VVGDGGLADEDPCADLRVRRPVARQSRDLLVQAGGIDADVGAKVFGMLDLMKNTRDMNPDSPTSRGRPGRSARDHECFRQAGADIDDALQGAAFGRRRVSLGVEWLRRTVAEVHEHATVAAEDRAAVRHGLVVRSPAFGRAQNHEQYGSLSDAERLANVVCAGPLLNSRRLDDRPAVAAPHAEVM
jgi:hypothetical protein